MSDVIKLSGVGVDCPDAGELAAFYAEITGGTVTSQNERWASMSGPGGTIDFWTVPNHRPAAWPEERPLSNSIWTSMSTTSRRPRRKCSRPAPRSTASSPTRTTATSTPTRPVTRSACPPGTTWSPDRGCSGRPAVLQPTRA